MDRYNFVLTSFNLLRAKGIVHTQKDFANLIGFSGASVSRALKGDEKYLTDSLVNKIQDFLDNNNCEVSPDIIAMFPALDPAPVPKEESKTILVIPTAARGGYIGDFAESVQAYDCERIISPIKDADYAMMVTGNSMAPDFPNGSQILIKKIQPEIFLPYGNVFVLDTCNGAVIKQIFPGKEDSQVECRSINPEYPPFNIAKKDVNGWYRVLMVMALK